MQEELDQRGFFWLQEPTGYADVRIPKSAKSGRLTIDQAGVIELQVDGDLGVGAKLVEYFTGLQNALQSDQVIAGYLNNGHRAFLYEVSLTDYNIVGGTVASHTFEALFCLVSRYSIHDQPIMSAVQSLQIEVSELDDWMNHAPIRTELIDRQPDSSTVKVSYQEFRREFQLPQGSLHFEAHITDPTRLGPTLPDTNVTFKQSLQIKFVSAIPKTLREWRLAFLDVEEFIALLLGSYCDFAWPSLVCCHGEEKDWFNFYFRRDGSVRSYKPAIHTALLKWNWVEESLGSTLAAWIDFKRRNPTACSHYMTNLLRQEIIWSTDSSR
jgi:hypothetical protein